MEPILERVGSVTVVFLPTDTLDASNVKEFKRDVGSVINERKKVVFDLERVNFVDSSGLGAILSCLRQLNAQGGDLKLCSLGKPVRALFELVRMHRIFDIYNCKDEAIRAFEN
ncbi:MAG: STAS domain-containing protein [Acidobacteriota bacterium]